MTIKNPNIEALMDIKNLTTFVHVAELGNFSRAGERLGYSQPSISMQIRQLEQELGFRLFDRIGHAVRLTDKGREALRYAQQVLRLCRQMSLDSPEDTSRDALIRLAASDSLSAYLLEERFSPIRSRYSGIRLKLTTAGTGELFRLLDHNEVDLVYTLDSHIYNASYVIAGEEKVGVHFVVSRNNPLAQKQRLTKKDLLRQDFLLTEKNMSYRRLLDEWMAKDSMEIRPVLETGRADLLCSLVEQGLGVSFLPDYATEQAVRRGTIMRMDAEGFHPELWKQLLYHREKFVSPAMQAVISLLAGLESSDNDQPK
ncbi:MAG: LysR family transcriptional regulator [Clostridia bacterium]|nr:LysR family transcriptional regulator [Clostridia bacterium]